MNSIPGHTVHESPRQIIGVAFIWIAIWCLFETVVANFSLQECVYTCIAMLIIGLLIIDH